MKHHNAGRMKDMDFQKKMKTHNYRIFVGIDLGSTLHQACVIDSNAAFLGELGFAHTAEALTELADWLLSVAKADVSQIAVAMEKPHGAVVDALLERGFAVYAINPKQVDRFRDRHSVSGAKDDRRDAFVLADALRTDLHRFQRVHQPPAEIINLRELLRINEELSKQEVVLTNRLREQLMRCFPHLLSLAPHHLMDPFLWEILKRFGSPEQTATLDKHSINALLIKYRIRRVSAEQVLDTLHRSPLPVAAGTIDAVAHHVGVLVKQLLLVDHQRRQNTKRIALQLKHFLQNPNESDVYTDATILSSLPGVGTIVLANLLCHGAEAIAQRDIVALRSLSGIAPVTKRSGKRWQVIMRRSCNHDLKNALYHWARVAIQKDARCRQHYDDLRAKGHLHGRALRGVMDRILTMTLAMLRQGTLYDPTRRGPLHKGP
jgi:transposase